MKKLKVMMMTLMMCLITMFIVSCDEGFEIDKDKSGMVDGYEAVDLGLSVRWATCNVGAESETDIGDYFDWGEVELYYLNLVEENMRFENGDSITKYCLDFIDLSGIYDKNQPQQNFEL